MNANAPHVAAEICRSASTVSQALLLASKDSACVDQVASEVHGFKRFLFSDGSLLALADDSMLAVDTLLASSLADYEEWLDDLRPLDQALLAQSWSGLGV